MIKSLLAAALGAIATLLLSAGVVPASAAIATRCDDDGCARIHCNFTGDRCFFIDGYDDEWRYACNGDCDQDDGYRDDDRYGGRRDGDCCGDYRGYYNCCSDGYVCDPDGDRCYESESPWWNYREYYRRHGYRWEDEG